MAAVNAFVLMDRVHKPRAGPVRAHQIAMGPGSSICLSSPTSLVYFAHDYSAVSLIYAGLFWMELMLAFEWGGSLLIRRPVHEILIGWHIERGYMWPYVLLTCLLSPLIIGGPLHRGRRVL